MKRAGVLLFLLFVLAGCSSEDKEMARAIKLRSDLLAASEVGFHASITADYGDILQTFAMDCRGNAAGDIAFSVAEPETISGITGTVSAAGGKLTFDDEVLYFDLLTDDQLSPVSAPWIFLKTLRSGYILSTGMEADFLRLTIDDSYDDDALRLDIWLDSEDIPVRGEILYDGRRILSLDITNFKMQ